MLVGSSRIPLYCIIIVHIWVAKIPKTDVPSQVVVFSSNSSLILTPDGIDLPIGIPFTIDEDGLVLNASWSPSQTQILASLSAGSQV